MDLALDLLETLIFITCNDIYEVSIWFCHVILALLGTIYEFIYFNLWRLDETYEGNAMQLAACP